MIELVDDARCTRCNLCIRVCPMDVFDLVADGPPVIARQDSCQTCFMCEAHCPVDALYVAPLKAPAPAGSPHLDFGGLVAGGVIGSYRARSAGAKGARRRAPPKSSSRSQACAFPRRRPRRSADRPAGQHTTQRVTVHHHRSRSAFPRVVVLAALVVAAFAALAGSAGAATKGFTLNYGVVSNNGQPEGANGWAYSQGKLLKELKGAGVTKIKAVTFPNGPNLAAALASGAIDIGELGDTPGLVAGGQGVKAKLLQIYQQHNQAWLIGRKGGPTTLAGLVGKKVATAPGSYMDRYLKGLVGQEGFSGKIPGRRDPAAGRRRGDPERRTRRLRVPVPARRSLAEQGYPVIDTATQHKGLAGNSVTLISDSALGKYPALGAAWRAATKADNQAVHADPNGYWTWEAGINKVTVSAAKASYPIANYPLTPFPATAVSALQGTLNYLVSSKQAKKFSIKAWEVPLS